MEVDTTDMFWSDEVSSVNLIISVHIYDSLNEITTSLYLQRPYTFSCCLYETKADQIVCVYTIIASMYECIVIAAASGS